MMHTTNTRKQTDTPSGTKQFTVPSWQTAPAQPMKAAEASKKGGIMAKIETLEHAKHRAAASFARMTSGGPESAQATTRDEQDVLRARVDVLNVLMRNPDARLCLESSGTGARACVTYDRMRCEGGELELGPMQSTMSWAVRGGEDPVLNLLSAGDNAAGHASVVRGLLGLIRESAPKKDVLQGLHELLALPTPERLVLKSVGGINSTRQDHTRVVEGLGEAGAGPVPPLYRITWGALDLDVLEGWQNPSTNTAIRLSILDTAHQSVREAERTKAPAWSNVSYLQARIFHNDECHVLSLRPFWDSESCTVSHLQYKQSVFDDSGPERGILNLTQDARAVHAIPMGKILPIQAYVCLGAHRKSRLNEAQLNYVHAQGLLAHGLDVKLLPDAGTLLENASAGKMIAAKSTRVSAEKLDIMASSYHVADQVYTTISVVQYPPFGTQFEKAKTQSVVATPSHPISNKNFPKTPIHTKSFFTPMPKLTMLGSDTPPSEEELYSPRSAGNQSKKSIYKTSNWGSQATSEDGTGSVDDDDDELDNNNIAAFPIKTRKESDNATPKYKEIRVDHTPQENLQGEKYLAWGVKMRAGEHFFVDGVLGDPFDINKRFIWFEIDNGKRYRAAEHLATQIRDYLRYNHKGMWHTDRSFYWNIHNNRNIGLDGRTPGDIWTFQWTTFIKAQIKKSNEADFTPHLFFPENVRSFWYTHDVSQWDNILDHGLSAGFSEIYKRRAQQTYDHYLVHGFVQSKLTQCTPRLESCKATNDPRLTIPMPQTLFSARASTKSILRQEANPAVLHQLQHRIDALETRLSRVHQEENTKHLLEQVLDKLDSLETAV